MVRRIGNLDKFADELSRKVEHEFQTKYHTRMGIMNMVKRALIEFKNEILKNQ